MYFLVVKKLLTFLFPPYCLGCGKAGGFICSKCRVGRIRYVHEHRCHVCGEVSIKTPLHNECRHLTYLDGVYICAQYEGLVKVLLTKAKYGFTWALLLELGEIMVLKALEMAGKTISDYDAVQALPLSRERLWWRGFNQSNYFAKALAKQFGLPVINGLVRNHFRRPQVGLSADARRDNIAGAFDARGSIPKSVILVDDIKTTGATLEQAAKALKAKGCTKVAAVVLASEYT